MTSFRHVEYLANTIGPRGSTTPKEKEAHDYCQATLEGLGYTVNCEPFRSPVSGWHPYALALGAVLLAVGLFWWLGRGADAQMGGLAALALGAVAVTSFMLHSLHKPNPLQWLLPVAPSQNVWAVAEPRGEVQHTVVLSGHVDSHRTALAMQSPALWQVFQLLTTLVGIANFVLLGLFIWGIATPDPLPRTLALVVGLLPLAGLVFTLQPDFTPYVVGANDNATGAAAVLGFAERLKAEPLEHTRVYLVNTGCEEVGCYGLEAFVRHHGAEAPGAYYLVLDNIGGKGSMLNYVLDETVLLPTKSDPGLVRLAEGVARDHPDLNAEPFHYRGLDSELSAASRMGQKALGLLNFDPKTKMPPNFHTRRDDLANVDPELLERSERFAWEILQRIDVGADAV